MLRGRAWVRVTFCLMPRRASSCPLWTQQNVFDLFTFPVFRFGYLNNVTLSRRMRKTIRIPYCVTNFLSSLSGVPRFSS